MNFDFSEKDLIMVAIKNYRNTRRNHYAEFIEDLQRVYQIRSLITRRANQVSSGKITEKINRIILNNIITFFNVFSIEFAKEYLFFIVSKEHHPVLKTIFIFLSFAKEDEYIEIPLDQQMVNFLRNQI